MSVYFFLNFVLHVFDSKFHKQLQLLSVIFLFMVLSPICPRILEYMGGIIVVLTQINLEISRDSTAAPVKFQTLYKINLTTGTIIFFKQSSTFDYGVSTIPCNPWVSFIKHELRFALLICSFIRFLGLGFTVYLNAMPSMKKLVSYLQTTLVPS